MPGAGTFITLGVVGAASAAAFVNKRRDSQQQEQTSTIHEMNPLTMARRRSSGLVQNDLYEARKQAEHHWRRHYGANFSHNSKPKFPSDQRS
ncbi:hypothetical protein BX666DRAFT_2011578, partial [Dichotomocladium elegans]